MRCRNKIGGGKNENIEEGVSKVIDVVILNLLQDLQYIENQIPK